MIRSGLDWTLICRQVIGVNQWLRSQLFLSWHPGRGRERERGPGSAQPGSAGVQIQPDAAFNLICKTRGQTMTWLWAWACSLSRSAQAARPLKAYTVPTQSSVFAALLGKNKLWGFFCCCSPQRWWPPFCSRKQKQRVLSDLTEGFMWLRWAVQLSCQLSSQVTQSV